MTEEAVADVLAELRTEEGPEPLELIARGDGRAEALTYEDWVRPLKLTGGRVCLRASTPVVDIYTRRRSDGVLETTAVDVLGNEVGRHTISPQDLKQALRFNPPEPVLRADTPFGGDD